MRNRGQRVIKKSYTAVGKHQADILLVIFRDTDSEKRMINQKVGQPSCLLKFVWNVVLIFFLTCGLHGIIGRYINTVQVLVSQFRNRSLDPKFCSRNMKLLRNKFYYSRQLVFFEIVVIVIRTIEIYFILCSGNGRHWFVLLNIFTWCHLILKDGISFRNPATRPNAKGCYFPICRKSKCRTV